MKRTDIHRPSAIVPADYEFVACECVKMDAMGAPSFIMAYREVIRAHMASTGGTYSKHAHAGNCHICGAHCIYTVLFYHAGTNTYIRTGTECADKLDFMGADAFVKHAKDAMKQQAGKRKAQAILETAGLKACWDLYLTQDPGPGEKNEEQTIRSITAGLVKYGKLSEKQVNFLRMLVTRMANREKMAEQRRIETMAAADLPVSVKRVTIRGKVVALKTADWGGTQMLIQHATGWKVFGSVPAALSGVQRGAEVQFDATIKPSGTDKKFGFFSRPSMARVVGVTA